MSDVPTAAKDFGLCLLRGRDREWIDADGDADGNVMALTFAEQRGMFRGQGTIPFTRDDVIKALMAYFEANRGMTT